MMLTLRAVLKRRPALAALPVAVLLLGVWALWAWWHSPDRAADAFAAAVERRDMGAMIALADPLEVKYLGLTPENVRPVLEDAARSPGGIRFLNLHKAFDDHGRVLYDSILADSSGRALPSIRSHQPGMQGAVANGIISVYRADGRWCVNLSSFLGDTARGRYPSDCSALFMRHGLPNGYLDQADSYWMSWQGHKIDPETLRPSAGS